MKTRQLTEEDLPLIASWFEDVPWNLPPVQNGTKTYGFLTEDAEGPLAVLHLYLTDTGYAFIDWVGTNPEREAEDCRKAMDVALETVEGACRHVSPEIGCIALYTRSEALAEVLRQKGYRSKKSFIQCTKLLGDE